MNAITLPLLALSIYIAAEQSSESRKDRVRNEREKRLTELLDSKRRMIQQIRWRVDAKGFLLLDEPGAEISEGEAAVAAIANFLLEKFTGTALSSRVTLANGQQYHPAWKENEINRFAIMTSGYAEVVKTLLTEVRCAPGTERTSINLRIASQISKDETTLIYLAASTLPFVWDELRRLVAEVAFFRWLPQATALRLAGIGWSVEHHFPIDDAAFGAGSRSKND